ncbi:MAG TPA: AEC family transporter [Dissulfurispiraceae bacterium]|nr:AEC family transporter [Dissulfurispiraceae bacterium]
MITVLWSLLPIFALIAGGFLLRAAFIRSETLWRLVEKSAYYVLFPSLLIVTLSRLRFDAGTLAPLLAITTAALLIVAAFLLVFRLRLPFDGPAFSSVFQGAIRYNTYVGLSAASAVYGEPGIALMALLAAAMIPTVNILSVYVLSRFASQNGFSWQTVTGGLVKNPLILSALTGLSLSVFELQLPGMVADILGALGKASLPLGLLAVGAGLNLTSISGHARSIALGSVLKLIVLPTLVWVMGMLAGIDYAPLTVAVLYSSLPTASSAFILARELGGDHSLMASIITVQTMLAFLTMPVILLFQL